MTTLVCGHCGRELERRVCASGKVLMASNETVWCDAREPWKRHRITGPELPELAMCKAKVDEPAQVEQPAEERPASERIQGYDATKCRRPDKDVLTKREAKDVALKLRRRGHPDVLAYRCTCNGWHVGKSRDHLKKRIRYALGVPQKKGGISR